MPEKVLEIKHVSKTYGARIAVNDVSFDVYEGEIFGFLGANGAGKTTLIKSVTGLSKQDSGEIIICGKNLAEDFTGAVKNIGAIIENPDMYGHLSGYENLKYFASFYDNVTDDDIWEAIRLVNMQARAKEKLSKYSLGMKQRMGIAQAIMSHPRLLVLDEPTNGLDPAGIKEIRDLFKKLSKEQNIAVFISSHILSEMQLMCDRVGIINNGELIAVREVGEILHGEGGREILEMKVDDIEKAIALLKEKFDITAENDYGEIRFAVAHVDIPKVNEALVENKIQVLMMKTVERTLEDIFLELTRNGGAGKIV